MELFIKDKKRFVVFAAAFLFLLISIAAGFLIRSSGPKREDKVSTKVSEKKVPDLFLEGTRGVALNYTGKEEKFPSELKIYESTEKMLSKEKASEIASAFGFTGEPEVFEDKVQGEILFWSDSEKTLRARLKQKTVKYALRSSVNFRVGALSFEEAEEVAKQFLTERGLFKNLSFKDESQYLKGLSGTPMAAAPAEAEGIKVSLVYKVSGYPLFDEFLGPEPVNLTILNDGRVAFVSYLVFDADNLRESGSVAVKTLAEAKRDFAQEKGVSVSVISGEPEVAQIPAGIISLSKISLVYFHSPSTASVQPIFVFEGPDHRVLIPATK